MTQIDLAARQGVMLTSRKAPTAAKILKPGRNKTFILPLWLLRSNETHPIGFGSNTSAPKWHTHSWVYTAHSGVCRSLCNGNTLTIYNLSYYLTKLVFSHFLDFTEDQITNYITFPWLSMTSWRDSLTVLFLLCHYVTMYQIPWLCLSGIDLV